MWPLLLLSVPVLWLSLCAVAVAVCAAAAQGDRTTVVAERAPQCGARRRSARAGASRSARHALR